MTDHPEPPELVKVARDLRELVALTADLSTEAAHKGTDSEAMVYLAPVASLEAWQHIIDARDEHERDTSHVADHDDSEPPLQTLLFWSEQWRVEHGRESDRRPTVGSEAAFLRTVLTWAYDNEPAFDDFAADVHKARVRLENVLRAGERAEKGVPCMYEECKGARLTRTISDDGERSDWFCPKCRREWDEDAYWRNVHAANERAQREEIGGEAWVTVGYAAREVGRSVKTIRTWAARDQVRKACMLAGRRRHFVSLADVERLDSQAQRKGAA